MGIKRFIFIDMDGTIIYNQYSGAVLCKLNGATDAQIRETERLEREQKLDWLGGDMLRAPLMRGLTIEKIAAHLDEIPMIAGLAGFMAEVKSLGFSPVLASAGPSPAAMLLSEKWGFDRWFASEYPTVDGALTGEIINPVTAEGKAEIVRTLCGQHGIDPSACAAMGDGGSDPDMLRAVGCSIALNADARAVAAAIHSVRTPDIRDTLPILREFVGR